MSNSFNPIEINHMAVAVRQEMIPSGQYGGGADVVFIGGSKPCQEDERQLAAFGLRKNYNIIFTACDVASSNAAPIGFRVVVTDGTAESIVLSGGRLWKRDRRTACVLLFPAEQVLIKVSTKGRLIVRPMVGRYHDQGYELADQSVEARAASRPGHGAVLAPIGDLPVVFDVKECAATFAAAA